MKTGVCSNCQAVGEICSHCWKCPNCCECEKLDGKKTGGRVLVGVALKKSKKGSS